MNIKGETSVFQQQSVREEICTFVFIYGYLIVTGINYLRALTPFNNC